MDNRDARIWAIIIGIVLGIIASNLIMDARAIGDLRRRVAALEARP